MSNTVNVILKNFQNRHDIPEVFSAIANRDQETIQKTRKTLEFFDSHLKEESSFHDYLRSKLDGRNMYVIIKLALFFHEALSPYFTKVPQEKEKVYADFVKGELQALDKFLRMPPAVKQLFETIVFNTS
jgi:hypothetical protein